MRYEDVLVYLSVGKLGSLCMFSMNTTQNSDMRSPVRYGYGGIYTWSSSLHEMKFPSGRRRYM